MTKSTSSETALEKAKKKRTKPFRILVCGDREWADRETIRKVLGEYLPDSIVHGACPGADTIGGEVGRELGCHVLSYPANWEAFGRRAGPIRNQAMLEHSTPDLVLAFHSDLGRSKGTLHMIRIATEKGIPVRTIKGEDV